MRTVVLFVCFFLFAGCHLKKEEKPSELFQMSAPVLASVNVQNMEVEVLKEFKVIYEVQVQQGVFARIPEFAAGITTLRVVDVDEEEHVEGNSTIYRTTIKLVADFEGAYMIPSFPVSYTTTDGGSGSVSTPSVYIIAGWPEELTAGMRDIVDIKDVVIPPAKGLYLIILSGAGSLILAGALFYFLYIRRRKEEKEERPSPAKLALEQLKTLEREKLPEKGDFRNFYFKLSEIFRTFVEEMYRFPALEMTTEELVKKLVEFPIKTEGLREFLELSDLPRYAGESFDVEKAYSDLNFIRKIIEEAEEKESKNVEV